MSEPRKARKGKTSIPEDFGITDSVRKWADGKGYGPFLEVHLEWFVNWARANGTQYLDWDAAFRNCLLSDWGNIRKNAVSSALKTVSIARPATTCEYRGLERDAEICGASGVKRGNGQVLCDHHELKRHERSPMSAEARAMLDKILRKGQAA